MILEFATKAGNKPKCFKGYPCGGGCISRQRNCKKPLETGAATFADWLKQSASVVGDRTTHKEAKAKRTSRKMDIAPAQTSSFASIERGFPADSPRNKRLNAKLEKELADLDKQAQKRVKQNPSLYSDNREVILSTKIAHLSNPEGTRIARSADGSIEAIANFEIQDRSIYVDFLATAPKNVDRNDPEYTRGNGTKMIIEAVKESVEKGKGGAVTLLSLPGAVKFYKKLGFKTKSKGKNATSMALSKANAQKLLDMSLNFAEQEMSFVDELEILELEAKGAFACEDETASIKDREKLI